LDSPQGNRDQAPAEEALRQPAPDLSAENAELRERLWRAEVSRLEVVEALDDFSAQMETLLATYRSQRAWKVMVWLRKAYTILTRQGKAAFLRFLAATPFTGGGPLETHEPEFPVLGTCLPHDLRKPYTAEPLAPELVDEVRLRRRRGVVPPADRYTVVVLPVFHYDYQFQRPQQLASHLARAGHRVFWICPRLHLKPDSPAPYRLREREKNLWEVNLRGRRFDFHAEVAGRETAALMLSSLERLYAECGIAENCVLVEWPAWHPVARPLGERFGARIVYDCMDNWDTFPDAGRPVVEEERRLAQSCDLVVVTSGALQAKFAALGKPAAVLRNAVDFDFFARAAPAEVLPGLRRPVVGYYGAIASWTDLDLVERAARSRPQYTFVLVGQNHDQDVARLAALDNVRILGQRPYREMPAWLRAFDVCMIPFRLSAITQATDPVKLYEYFSLGKPVVATAMRELAAFGDLLYRAADAEDFLGRLDAAAAEDDPELRRRRIEFARANTWAARVAALDAEIRKTFPLLSILLVTHNSREFVGPCLDSIRRHTHWPNYEVVAVDNASADGTAELLKSRAAADPRLRVFPLESNTGFAGGNNFAARQARGEYFVLLNADVLVNAGWAERLLRPIRRNPQAAIAVAVTNFAGNEAKINAEYRNQEEMEAFAGQIARERAGQSLDLRVAPLFCALIPRSIWRQLGELDESFTVGMFEDDDYSQRARRAGYRLVTAEDCFVHHFGQGSFAQLPAAESERIFEANRERFERKWGEAWQPHRYRPQIRPAHRERRFLPAEFCRPPESPPQ
jgi:GT2 family glycosyltransferase/glycosyltransferase involved in cell wall biosynthesis